MKHITIYDNYDFLGMQAAAHGMSREEWMAHFGSSNESKNSVLENDFSAEDDIRVGDNIEYYQLMGMGKLQDWVKLTGVVVKIKKKRKDPFGNVNPHKEFHLRSGSVISRFKNHKDISLAEKIDQKYIMTYEAYVTYDKLKKWGVHPPSEVENELREKLVQLFIYGGISNHLDDIQFTDMSSEKGIKWEIQVKGLKKGNDVIHVYKTSVYRMDYEWYLNKKKSSTAKIQEYFLDKYVSDLDQYLASLESFDRFYDRADDHRVYLRGSRHADRLLKLYKGLSSSDKKKAHKAYIAKTGENKDFKSFSGI